MQISQSEPLSTIFLRDNVQNRVIVIDRFGVKVTRSQLLQNCFIWDQIQKTLYTEENNGDLFDKIDLSFD